MIKFYTYYHASEVPEETSRKQMVEAGLLGIAEYWEREPNKNYANRIKTLYFFKDKTVDDLGTFKRIVYKNFYRSAK